MFEKRRVWYDAWDKLFKSCCKDQGKEKIFESELGACCSRGLNFIGVEIEIYTIVWLYD